MAGSSGCVVANLRYLSRRRWNDSVNRVEIDQQEINRIVYDSIEVGRKGWNLEEKNNRKEGRWDDCLNFGLRAPL